MKNKTALLWVLVGIFTFGLFFGGSLIPRLLETFGYEGPQDSTFTLVFAGALVVTLALQAYFHRRDLQVRNLGYGSRSTTTVVLVLCIIGLLNVLTFRNPNTWDLTPEKLHTLSHHSEKMLKTLSKDVKLEAFGKLSDHEQFRPLLNNYRNLSTRVEVEFIDVDRQVTRTKQAGITKPTVRVVVGERSQKLEAVDEEKLTNALLSLTQDGEQILCFITGHGEGDLEDKEADGFSATKEDLQNRAYKVKTVDLPRSEEGIPKDCRAIVIAGPTSAFFEKELEILEKYLIQGGRAVLALGHDLTKTQGSENLSKVLSSFHVKWGEQLIVDPLSTRTSIGDPAVPLLIDFNKSHDLSKIISDNVIFVWSRPIEVLKEKDGDISIDWLAKTTRFSFGESAVKSLIQNQGRQRIQKDPGEPAGPLTAAVAIKGKHAKNSTESESRIVVFGSSRFANNNFRQFGFNTDFFINAISWVIGDENQVSIAKKEVEGGKIELSIRARSDIRNLTVFAIPGLIAFAGFVNWRRRKKL